MAMGSRAVSFWEVQCWIVLKARALPLPARSTLLPRWTKGSTSSTGENLAAWPPGGVAARLVLAQWLTARILHTWIIGGMRRIF